MKWYNDDKNVIVFPGLIDMPEDFQSIKKERRILYNIINACFKDHLDPFSVLTAFCVSDVASLICKKSHLGYFYGEGRFLMDLKYYNFLKERDPDWDIVCFHWVLDVYLTARYSLNMTYYEIASEYPVECVYRSFNPLHETSELNALNKMHFDPVKLCGCIINDKYYLYEKDVPQDKRYLLSMYDDAHYWKGLIFLNTTFFHLVNEENGYLSNWYPSKFTIDDREFSCVEQYMMWRKAMMFGDEVSANDILTETDPAKMKKIGRHVKGYVDSRWSAERFTIVREAILAKFTQNDELKAMFLSTPGKFAECAVNDLVWGIGLSMTDPKRIDQLHWRGDNLLGFALEDVYNELKSGN